jgi:putative ATPase
VGVLRITHHVSRMTGDNLDLFASTSQATHQKSAPLADRIRPSTLQEFIGQRHILGEGKALQKMIEQDELSSFILWGPPGSGKTTLAKIVANITKAHFVFFSATMSGVPELRKVVKETQTQLNLYKRKTVLFVDEIHRLNKLQQDAFLPHIENGTIILIGATTENPSFEVNRALLSRCQVYILHQLSNEDIVTILQRALRDSEDGLGKYSVSIQPDVLSELARYADGDTRIALNILELVVLHTTPNKHGVREVSFDTLQDLLGKKTLGYDKHGEEHYNVISAFIKSMRGSDPDAAVYYLARMLETGEDPMFIARRMVILASEDIGNADPQALQVAVAAMQAVHFVGLPEAQLSLTQAVIYLALAPKSNSVLKAIHQARADVREYGALPVPLHLRNAPTTLMKEVGYGHGYKYAHDYEGNWVEQAYLPESLQGRRYYISGSNEASKNKSS